MDYEVSFVREHRALLGESPLWDAGQGVLWWVDSMACLICQARPDGLDFRSWEAPSFVGSIGLADQGLVAALRDGFYLFDPDNGSFLPIILPEAGNEAVRFNDGKTDRQGRFLSGTMRHGGVEGAPGKLYRLGLDGNVDVLETEIAVSNAICFSPTGDTLYFADSVQRCIWAYDYDSVTASNRRVLIDTAPLGSAPDGATVDSDGNLWVALVLTQQIGCFSSDGALLRLIEVPVPFPSCPAFGGENRSTLFITSISDSRGALVSDHPDAGRILRIDGLGVSGIAETPFAA